MATTATTAATAVLLFVVLVVVGVGCGSGDSGAASSLVAPGPSAPSAEAPEVGRVGPSVDSAARFAVEVVARLEQEAFWAHDGAFVDGVATVESRGAVGGVLDARVEDVRWAIATFPGPTRRTWFVSAPLTVEVAEFDPVAGTALVRVWVVSVFSREDLGRPEAGFTIEEAALVWDETGGGWLVSSLSSGPGPAVGLGVDDVPVTAAELGGVLAGHRLIGIGLLRGNS